METVEILIKMPKNTFGRFKNMPLTANVRDAILEAVENGTVLPKEHGKIIDVDQFYKVFNEYLSERKSFSFADLETILNVVTPPILKADKEIENETDN